jgi:hypothetical protein
MTHFPRGHHETHPHLPDHPHWVHDGDDFHAPPTRRPRPPRHPVDPLAIGIVAAGGVVSGLLILWSLLDHGSRQGTAPVASSVATRTDQAANAIAAADGVRARSSSRSDRAAKDPRAGGGWSSGVGKSFDNKSMLASNSSGDSHDSSSLGPAPFGLPPFSSSNRGTHNPFESEMPMGSSGSIDTLVLAKLEELKIPAAKVCSDEVFVRRLYLDVLGTLPTADEARRFLEDPDPEKRSKLIDHVLERPEFADYWAMRWCDVLRVKAEFPIKLWPYAALAYHGWVRESIRRNVPYDDFARELLTASGSNFRKPQVNFYRAVQNREPSGLASAVALTFLGERTEGWPTERLEGMSRFFAQVGFKPTGEWKEEIVYFDRRKGKTAQGEGPAPVFPNGKAATISPGEDPRRVFADWLVRPDNPWFARVLANRVWSWLLGRGVVEPADDVHRGNPAANLALLNYLATELVEAEYDPRHLYRVILNSRVYQLSCIPLSDNPQAAVHFAYYPVRRLDAEVLIDAICQVTGTWEVYMSIIPEPFTFLPEGQRAVSLPDGSITSAFLEMFGRPARDTGLLAERSNRLSAAQALHLLNSNHLREKLRTGPAMREIVHGATNARQTAETLYLTLLSRFPTSDELALAEGMCGYEEGSRDLAWALMNSDEFLFRH